MEFFTDTLSEGKNISIVNDSLFYKRPYVESDDTWMDGKGEPCTKEYHFEISYEELADILVSYGKEENE